jgi:hypothetical protein
MGTKGHKGNDKHIQQKQPYFDKSSATVRTIVNRTLFSRYPCTQYIIYESGSELKLHFETLCDSYGLKHKPTSIKNPQVNAILKRMHQTIMAMFLTSEIDMEDTINEHDIADFLTNPAWAICSAYHTVLKTSPGAALFGRNMLFDVPFLADWSKIGEYRPKKTDKNTVKENIGRVDWDYQLDNKVLVIKDVTLRKSESQCEFEPWTIRSAHTNGTIRIQHVTESERLNIGRVTPYFE